jgi:hypothetical protein
MLLNSHWEAVLRVQVTTLGSPGAQLDRRVVPQDGPPRVASGSAWTDAQPERAHYTVQEKATLVLGLGQVLVVSILALLVVSLGLGALQRRARLQR